MSCESEVPDDKFSAGDLLQRVSKARVFAGNGNRFALTHKLVVDAPDGTARAYKFATETDEVPALLRRDASDTACEPNGKTRVSKLASLTNAPLLSPLMSSPSYPSFSHVKVLIL